MGEQGSSSERLDDAIGLNWVMRRVMANPSLPERVDDPEALDSSARDALFALAEVLGRSRLLVVDLEPALDGTLSLPMAMAVVQVATREAESIRADFNDLRRRKNSLSQSHKAVEPWTTDPEEENRVIQTMSRRLTLVAVREAVEEAYYASVGEEPELVASMETKLREDLRANELLDRTLSENIGLLLPVRKTNLLHNWFELLREEHKALAAKWWFFDEERWRNAERPVVFTLANAVAMTSKFHRLYRPLIEANARLAAGTVHEVETFPPAWADVPMVAIWRAYELETATPAPTVRQAWVAYFNARLFLVIQPAIGEQPDATSIRVRMTQSIGASLDCPRIFREASASPWVWDFMSWLAGETASDRLLVFAVPMDQAAAASQESTTLVVERAGIETTLHVPSVVDVLTANVPISELWALMRDFYPRNRLADAMDTLLGLVVAHEYLDESALSQTLAFYAFWLALVQGKDGRLLETERAQRLVSGLGASSAWPSAYSDALRRLLSTEGSGAE